MFLWQLAACLVLGQVSIFIEIVLTGDGDLLESKARGQMSPQFYKVASLTYTASCKSSAVFAADALSKVMMAVW